MASLSLSLSLSPGFPPRFFFLSAPAAAIKLDQCCHPPTGSTQHFSSVCHKEVFGKNIYRLERENCVNFTTFM